MQKFKKGEKAYIIARGMNFLVIVHEEKAAYGRVRYLVEPMRGEGKSWVDISNLVFIPVKK